MFSEIPHGVPQIEVAFDIYYRCRFSSCLPNSISSQVQDSIREAIKVGDE
jgi:hypothetical protein